MLGHVARQVRGSVLRSTGKSKPLQPYRAAGLQCVGLHTRTRIPRGASVTFPARQQHIARRGFAAQEGYVGDPQEDGTPNELIRLSYTSQLVVNKDAQSKAIEEICQAAAIANRKSNITGILCYDSRLEQVWQVLEGDRSHVEGIWAKIKSDSRHEVHPDTIAIMSVQGRLYPQGWGMKLRRLVY